MIMQWKIGSQKGIFDKVKYTDLQNQRDVLELEIEKCDFEARIRQVCSFIVACRLWFSHHAATEGFEEKPSAILGVDD